MGASTTTWDRSDIVGGFARSSPNQTLMEYVSRHRCPWFATRVLDIGCGAGRNAVPLASHGFNVVGIDRSRPMLQAAAGRDSVGRLRLLEAGMDDLPMRARSIDVLIAHGIWNLARSGGEFRRAVREAARVANAGATLFVFTFSRSTLPPAAQAVTGESFVFTQFSGTPQVFLTKAQLVAELRSAGFEPDEDLPLRELNLPQSGRVRTSGAPVIFEGGFRKTGD